jgi:hypothetical protein
MTKDIGVIVALPPELKEWVEAQAEDIGVNAAIWIRMLVFAAWKGRASVAPVLPPAGGPSRHALGHAVTHSAIDAALDQQPYAPFLPPADVADDPDAWRGPVDDESGGDASGVDIEEMIASRLADVDTSGPVSRMPPVEAFGPPPHADIVYGSTGGVRSLHRPPIPFAAGNQPRHLRSLV